MWEELTIGDSCEVIAGQSPKGEYYNTEGNGLAFYQGKKDFGFKFIRAPSKWTTQVTKEAQAGDVLMSVRAPVGPINFSTERICIGRGLVAIRPSNKINKDFLFYGLLEKQKEICGNEGAVFASINKAQISAINFPLPPLEEQKRIVAILDEAFAGIDKAIANTEKNLVNARELFESYLNNIFTQKGDGWVVKKMSELCEKITDGTHQTPKYFDEGYIFLSSRNVTKGVINWDNIKYIDEVQHTAMQKRISPHIGDILLAKNGTTGVAAMVDRDVIFDIYVSLAHIRSLGEIKPELLLKYINSPLAKKQFNKRLKGTGVPNLHLKEIREVQVSFPTCKTQQDELIELLCKLQDQSQSLEKVYQQKLEALNELKQSLLQKAFAGELTSDMREVA